MTGEKPQPAVQSVIHCRSRTSVASVAHACRRAYFCYHGRGRDSCRLGVKLHRGRRPDLTTSLTTSPTRSDHICRGGSVAIAARRCTLNSAMFLSHLVLRIPTVLFCVGRTINDSLSWLLGPARIDCLRRHHEQTGGSSEPGLQVLETDSPYTATGGSAKYARRRWD
jgi:hypothetical protein